MVAFAVFALSLSLFAENKECFYPNPYSYFIYNDDSISEEQLNKINQLKAEYQPKIFELKGKIYLEKTKMNLEMSKEKPNIDVINNSINMNKKYSKELEIMANDFLKKYKSIIK